MKYLFFDCECANFYEHVGKMCSFGYVITSDSYTVLESKDIIINPEAPFDPHVLGQGSNSIDLAYTPIRFETAEKFPYYYETIKALLTAPDTMVFGFAIDNDVGFLLSACRRYGLEPVRFSYHDIQDMYRVYAGYDRSPSLEAALKDLSINTSDYEGHESKDDAAMSMLVLRQMMHLEDVDMATLLSYFPSSAGDVSMNIIANGLASLPNRCLEPYDREGGYAFSRLYYAKDEAPVSSALEGYGFLFSRSAKESYKKSLPLAKKLVSEGGLIVRSLRETSFYLVVNSEEKADAKALFANSPIVVLTMEEALAL